MMPKVHIKIEQIARLRAAGSISDDRIATLLGLTRAGLSRILALPEYQEAEQAALTGVVTKMDEALAGRANEIRKVYAVGVPLAMKAMLEMVQQKKDLRQRLEAAKEILDRDPQHTYSKNAVELPNGASLPADLVAGIVADAEVVTQEITAAPAKEVIQ